MLSYDAPERLIIISLFELSNKCVANIRLYFGLAMSFGGIFHIFHIFSSFHASGNPIACKGATCLYSSSSLIKRILNDEVGLAVCNK